MAKPYDATLKQLLDDYTPDWAAWLARHFGYPPGPLVVLNPEIDAVQLAADRVFRLPDNAGILHLEVQSSWDGDLPGRMLAYNVFLDRRERVPVHSVAILLRREANAMSLTGRLVRRRPDGRPSLTFDYDVVRVWELPAADLLAGDLGTAPLGLLTDDAEPRLSQLVHQFAERVESEVADEGRQSQLLACSSLLLGLRYDTEQIANLFMGVQKMRESSVYRSLIAEGRAEGLAEGEARGEEKGEVRGEAKGAARGRLEELRLTLVALIEQRFGGIAPELGARIRQTSNPDVLRAAIRQVLTVATAADIVL